MKIKALLSLACLCGGLLAINPAKATEQGINRGPETCGADFSSGIYSYQLENKIYDNPNTISFRTRLGRIPEGQIGGPIFSNYCQYNPGSVEVKLDEIGQICLSWNNGEVEIIFDEYPIQRDVWGNYTIVRDIDNKAFLLYVDGELVQEVGGKVGSNLSPNNYHYVIGGNWANWHEDTPVYYGEISHVTLYKTSLAASQVKNDFDKPEDINFANKGTSLLFNGEFTLGCEIVEDNSCYKNNAVLKSNNYFYDGELATNMDYSFGIIPDPQMLSNHRRDYIHHYGDYMAELVEPQKLAAVMCVGDNADATGNWDAEMGATSAQLESLDDFGIVHTTVPGNHDYDTNTTTDRSLKWLNKYFPVSKYSKYPWWGGCQKTDHIENSYYLFNAGGVGYVIICLEFGADDDSLAWACSVCEEYPDRRVIIVTHSYLDADAERLNADRQHAPSTYTWSNYVDVNDGDEFYNQLIKKYENIFLVYCGHIPADDIMMRQDIGDNGNVITSFLVNDQGLMSNDADEALLGLFAFNEKEQTITLNYTSCITHKLYNIQNNGRVISFKGNTKILSTLYYNADGTLK